MTTLDFCDYLNICDRLFYFCDYVRRRAPIADSFLLKDSQKWENELLPGYNNPQKLQLSCREHLKGKDADEVEEYRQKISIEGTIKALEDDLKNGAVYCPDDIKGWLILSIGGLATLCSHLSQWCFEEFDKIKNKGINENTPPSITELLARKPEAMEYFLNLLSEGEKQHLDKNCRWKERGNQAFLASIIRIIEDSFPDAKRGDIASFLGITINQVRGSKNNYKA